MAKPLIPTTTPERLAPRKAPLPYNPEWLNALTDADKQSPEMQEFSRRMLNSGARYVTWLAWHYQEKSLWTPPMAPWR